MRIGFQILNGVLPRGGLILALGVFLALFHCLFVDDLVSVLGLLLREHLLEISRHKSHRIGLRVACLRLVP